MGASVVPPQSRECQVIVDIMYLQGWELVRGLQSLIPTLLSLRSLQGHSNRLRIISVQLLCLSGVHRPPGSSIHGPHHLKESNWPALRNLQLQCLEQACGPEEIHQG